MIMNCLCFACNKEFLPRKTAYGTPEEVHHTLYEYGCKPICYKCYYKMSHKNFFSKIISVFKDMWTANSSN